MGDWPTMDIHVVVTIWLAGALVIAAVTDIRSSRIPNWLTLSLAASGMVLHTATQGWEGLLFSLEGLGIGIGCLLLFYVKGGMGAGDVKFLGGIGALLGADHVFQVFLVTALLGGLYSLAMMTMLGGVRYAWDRAYLLLTTLKVTHQMPRPAQADTREPKLRYALVMGLGTVIAQTLSWYNMW